MKKDFVVRLGDKHEFDELLTNHHYIQKTLHRKYRVGVNVVLCSENKIIGVAIFTGFPVPELVVGMFGLERTDQQGFYELSRFCLLPEVQAVEHNLATWFLARAIKLLKKTVKVRALLSYADDDFHKGTIYRAYGFDYYGLTAPKKDWKKLGSSTPCSRGKKGVGEWVTRSRKHRFLIVFDKTLHLKWLNTTLFDKG